MYMYVYNTSRCATVCTPCALDIQQQYHQRADFYNNNSSRKYSS